MDIFSHLFVVKIVMNVWKDENKWKRGRGWPILSFGWKWRNNKVSYDVKRILAKGFAIEEMSSALHFLVAFTFDWNVIPVTSLKRHSSDVIETSFQWRHWNVIIVTLKLHFSDAEKWFKWLGNFNPMTSLKRRSSDAEMSLKSRSNTVGTSFWWRHWNIVPVTCRDAEMSSQKMIVFNLFCRRS